MHAPQKLTYYVYPSTLGPITIAATQHGICTVLFGEQKIEGAQFKPSPLTNNASTQIQEYLGKKRTHFNVALDMQGSTYQQQVWEEVCRIAYAHTKTSTEIARALGNEKAFRNVGAALHACKVSLLVPLHRVVGANGSSWAAGKAGKHMQLLREFETACLSAQN